MMRELGEKLILAYSGILFLSGVYSMVVTNATLNIGVMLVPTELTALCMIFFGLLFFLVLNRIRQAFLLALALPIVDFGSRIYLVFSFMALAGLPRMPSPAAFAYMVQFPYILYILPSLALDIAIPYYLYRQWKR